MSTTLEEVEQSPQSDTKVGTQYLNADGEANVALLQDRTPPWMRASTPVVWLSFALGALFTMLSYARLWHSDLWGHLSYGRWIWSQGRVPTTEPLMPLAQGIPFTDTAWLSQLIGYGMIERFGAPGIQFLYASLIVLTAGLLVFAVYRRSRSAAAALLTLAAFYWGEYQQLFIVRPQLAGMACFTLVFVLATRSKWTRWQTFGIPAVFALWANLHGSFVIGLAMLAALCLGRAVDVWRRSRSLRLVFAERRTRSLLIALELSAVAVLLNPYGLAVYAEVLAVAGNANVKSLIEWEPLTLRMAQGRAAACLALGLVILYRMTPRRITTGEVLLLCGLGAGALWYSRMIVWWAPVAAYYLGLHAAALLKSWWKAPAKPVRSSGLASVVLVGLLWICFAYTPFGYAVLHGQSKDPKEAAAKFRKSVSPQTPVEITQFLRENPPTGLTFNVFDWGDYLLWAGPENMQLFMNSHAHLVSPEVWQDYLKIANGSSDWRDKLERYGVNAIIVDRQSRASLIEELERSADWELKYGDRLGTVFFRKNPI